METDTAEDLCRCCHSKGSLKSLNSFSKLKKATFAMLLLETFKVKVLPISNTSLFCICEDCVHKLHDAATFKQSVLECEEKFYKMLNSKDEKSLINNGIKVEINTHKVEYNTNHDNDTNEAETIVIVKYEPPDDEFEETIEHETNNVDSDDSSQDKPESSRETKGEHTKLSDDSEEDYVPEPRKSSSLIYNKNRNGPKIIPCETPYHTTDLAAPSTISTISNEIRKLGKRINSASEEMKKLSCSHCTMTFVQLNTFKKHLKTKHNVLEINLKKDKKVQKHQNRVCDLCGQKFTQAPNFCKHMKNVHGKPFACTKCPKTFQKEFQLKRHDYKLHGGVNPLTCEFCNKQYETLADFVIHRRSHTGETPYPCNICDREFNCQSTLRKHVKYTHKHKPRIKKECTICNKQYLNLPKHMLTAHSDEKPFACSVCDKRFTLNEYLNLHMRSHTGERPYTCEICGKSFTQRNVLKTHMSSGVCLKKCS